MENLKYYDALRRPPQSALRTIKGGRMNGKTDINPQWRYEAMTQQFGPCGIGWRYEIVRLWNVEAGDQIAAFSEVKLYVKHGEEWSEPIPGIGGSMFITQESKGLYVSDECYKMATTDALSVAMKMLGMAGDIYAGKFDGSKYSEDAPQPTAKPKPDPKPDSPPNVCDYEGKEGEYPLPEKLQKDGRKQVKDIAENDLQKTIEWAEKYGYSGLATACKICRLPF